MFRKLRPDIKYKPLVIDTRDRLFRKKTIKEIQIEFQNKLSKILDPGERVSYLIIGTHGSSRAGDDTWSQTSLKYLGNFYGHYVGEDFEKNFSSIKDRTTDDLKIIMNSCNTFCAGGKPQSERRAQQVLNYFGAINGGIYGADVPEVGTTFDHPKYLTLRAFVPSFKSFLMTNLLFSLLIFDSTSLAVIGDIVYSNFEKTITLNQLALSSVFVGTYLNIFMQTIMPFIEKTKSILNVNHGYYFSYENGHLKNAVTVIKKDEMINWVKGYHSSNPSCQQIFK